jgi:hypothetical protein
MEIPETTEIKTSQEFPTVIMHMIDPLEHTREFTFCRETKKKNLSERKVKREQKKSGDCILSFCAIP